MPVFGYSRGHTKFNLTIWIIDVIQMAGLWVADDRYTCWDNNIATDNIEFENIIHELI